MSCITSREGRLSGLFSSSQELEDHQIQHRRPTPVLGQGTLPQLAMLGVKTATCWWLVVGIRHSHCIGESTSPSLCITGPYLCQIKWVSSSHPRRETPSMLSLLHLSGNLRRQSNQLYGDSSFLLCLSLTHPHPHLLRS
jgi:hypothetical protein